MTVQTYAEQSARRVARRARSLLVSESLIYWRDKRDEGVCRMCLRPHEVRPLTSHHVVPLRWFVRHARYRPLRNVAPNRVPLCRVCHDDVELSRLGRRQLRRLLAPDEVAFVLQVVGRDWLDQRYPP